MRYVAWAVVLVASGCGVAREAGNGGGGGPADLAMHADKGTANDFALAPPPDLPQSGQCLPGDYVGTYDGQILIGNIVPAKTSGTVNLTLQASGGEFFTIMNGHLMGMASKHPYSADLVGTLDCSKLKLVNGLLKNGQVTISGITYMFEGPLTADYDPLTVSFINGVWDIKQVPMPSSSGKGTWTAKHM